MDAAAPAGGDGSAARPFNSAAQAIKAAAGGDVITLAQGVYRESLAIDKSGTAEKPTTVRAAPGQRVILSAFVPVPKWEPLREGIFTAVIDGPVEALFVGYAMQPLARWPDSSEPWRYVADPNPAAGAFRDRQGLAQEKLLAEIAQRPASARLYLYLSGGNFFRDAPLAKLDPATGQVTTSEAKYLAALKGEKDRFQVVNHVSLIRAPGQWAFETLEGNKTRLFFRPADPADLQSAQVRQSKNPVIRVGHWKNTVSHVRIEGIEVTGGDVGIELGRAENTAVSRCIVHHNIGNGIAARRGAHLEFDHNIIFANGNGLGIASSHHVSVHHNEIALNMVDGLTVAGNVSGKPDGEPTTADVNVHHNYIHHHLLLGHPDNVQTYRGVQRLTLENNVLLWGGQGIMTEETDHCVIRNCVVVGTGAIAVIFGHSNASDWTVERSTIGLGGWGALSMTASDYNLNHNIFFHNAVGLGGTIRADYNLFATVAENQPVAIVSKPRHKAFTNVADASAATGQQAHSLVADPQFRAAPARQAMATWDDQNTRDRLVLRQINGQSPTAGFAVNDQVEINGDGILRRVTAVDASSIRFDPPLPQTPLRGGLIWNWKDARSAALDLRPKPGSPALTAGQEKKAVGADLDIQAYQKGDFDSDGRRDLPELPEDLRKTWPNPNDIPLPLHGH